MPFSKGNGNEDKTYTGKIVKKRGESYWLLK